MTRLGGWAQPGAGTIDQTTEYEIFWGGDRGKGMVLEQSAKYSGAMRDAGNTPTTVIRAGLLMGQVTASNELEEWDADASDGTEQLFGVVPYELRAQDFDANNADRVAGVVVRAPLKAASLLIQGTALTSHVDEFLARRALHAMGCVLDDDPQGALAGAVKRFAQVTGTTDTLTESQNGMVLFYNNAASVTVTLPTIHPGLEYWLWRNGDEEFIVASAEGDNILADNNAAADTVTFTTASEHLGAYVHVYSVYVGTTATWLMEVNDTLTRAFAG